MRALLAFSTVALFAAFSAPASAQMCGGGQAQASSGGMCGGMKAETVAPAAGEQQTDAKKSGCPCCQNMALMQPKEGEAMPGMEMPSEAAPNPAE
jgi:hypothetical protein